MDGKALEYPVSSSIFRENNPSLRLEDAWAFNPINGARRSLQELKADPFCIFQTNDFLKSETIERRETVNHPRHYNAHPSGVECITIVEHMSFNVGNAIKYLWRADEKGNALEDLKKAAWYVQREIEKREKSAS